ncbi:MAG: hypothetical protein CVU84_01410 [Firmicutes bacterium HGW-Firmicutes-1]|jgi:polyketide synthase PksN|nr:MAG: hypothetical protein CVU84_01410 [Firmicutes bacterium HGW-Firmicutes-1]
MGNKILYNAYRKTPIFIGIVITLLYLNINKGVKVMGNNKGVKTQRGNLYFSNEDLENFSLASHDSSPLHMDETYANKTTYSQRLLFGFLGALACLGKVKEKPNMKLDRAEIKFVNPMYTDKEYFLNKKLDDRDELIEVFDEEKAFMSLTTHYTDMETVIKHNKNADKYDLSLHSSYLDSLQEVSLDYCEEELQKGVIKTGYYSTNQIYVEKLKKRFITSDSVVKPIHIDSFMMCSYIAGMILPGRRSLCIKLNMNFHEMENYDSNKLEYSASSISYDKSFGILRINIKIYSSGQLLSQGELNVCVRKENILDQSGFADKSRDTIVIASTFTSEPLLACMNFWEKELNFSLHIEFAQYNQVFQELLNPNSIFSNNTAGMNVILLRFGDWLRFREVKDSHENTEYEELNITKEDRYFLNATLENLISALQSYCKRSNAFTLLLLCPFATSDKNSTEMNSIFDELENRLVMALKDMNSIGVLNANQYTKQYSIKEIFDPARDKMGHVPFTIEYYHMLGTLINRRFYQLKNKPYKVIVLDCDNTLWEGVCGEVGSKGVTVKGAYRELQKYLVKQTQQGKLLCLCSKNVEEDVWKVFDEKKSMPLKRKYITDSKINWKSKSENIKHLAQTLNLGLDSFVFIDDNPVECAEVRANCSEVLTIRWPEETKDQVKLLNHFWILDQYAVTDEDKIRTQLYKANVERTQLEESSNDYNDFIKSLNIKVQINSMINENVSRVAQLTERTNQFNFTSIRRKPNEINQIINHEGYECFTVEVEDKFGSYGLVGVMIMKEEKERLIVDSFLLSCRVLGRGIEYEMVARLGKFAKERNLEKVELRLNKTAKNQPAKLFLEEVISTYKIVDEDSVTTYLVSAEDLSIISFSSEKYTTCNINATAKPSVHTLSISTREKENQLERIYNVFSDIYSIAKEIRQLEDQPIITKCDKNLANDPIKIMASNTLFQQVLDEMMLLFSKHLSVPYDALNGDDELEQYSIDSFKIMDIMVSLGNEYVDIPSTLLFEHRNLKSIAHYLIENYREMLEIKYPSLRVDPNITPIHVENNTAKLEENYDDSIRSDKDEDVAIIGMNGLFPNSNTVTEFWNVLVNGQSCIREIPKERWNLDFIFDPTGDKPDKTYSKWGAFIDHIDKFEPSFFNISPKEAELMDPQQRLFLQVVWGLFEDAGYTADTIDRNTGVFAAVVASDYGTLVDEASLKGISSYRDTDFYQIPNRVSYCFDFNGPSLSINTACSGSGTAVHLAYESLRRGECNTAVVGGINLFIHPSRWIQYAQIHFHSPDGICRPFGEGANGTVFGEGVGAVLLKRLSDARKDKDNIYGVIRGSAINSGGKTNGFTVPNPKAQAELISKTLLQAKVNPRTISYIEAHGTGTSLGDPIEIRGLTMAFKESGKKYTDQLEVQYCSLGSLKANFGHSESAAALSGMIKILLQMKYETFVPSLYSAEINSKIPFDHSPFIVQQKADKWLRPILHEDGVETTYPRRAGISSFGAGGSNSHIIVEEYMDEIRNKKIDSPQLIILSSKNEKKLRMLATHFVEFLEKNMVSEFEVMDGNKTITLAQIAYTLQVGRMAMEERVAFFVSNFKELVDQLKLFMDGQKNEKNIYRGNIKATSTIVKNLYQDDSDEFIQMMMNEGKLHKLAQLWILGVEIKWNILHDENPGRVSLPGYTFDGEKYWIPDMDMNSKLTHHDSLQLLADCNACAAKDVSAIQVGNGLQQTESHQNINNLEEQDDKKITYYNYSFIEAEILQEDVKLAGNLLLFDTNEELYHTFKEKYGKDFPVILVKQGKDYRRNEDGTYEIDFLKKEDYLLLIEQYTELPNKIICKWDQHVDLVGQPMDKQLEANFNAMLYLSQAFMKKMSKQDITLLYVYSSTDQLSKPEHGAMSSFAKTITQENPKFKYKTIDVHDTDHLGMKSDWLIVQLIKELNNQDKNVEINYRDGKRFIKVYNKVEIVEDLNEKKILREQGVYLITGGLGGLGFIFSEYLARNLKASLVLTGRSELDTKRSELIRKLEALGSKVMYIKADISNAEDVNNLIVQAKARFHEINGVFHSAGVLKSEFILNKKKEDIKEVFASKVKGSIQLDEATKDENLDFFVFFSSLSAAMGSVGYCDYATANSFMDHYASNRQKLTSNGMRKGLSLAIAWPFWEEGGMRLSDWSIANLKTTIGMIPLETEYGIQALLDGLALGYPNLVVIQGQEEKGLAAFEYNSLKCHVTTEALLRNDEATNATVGEEQLLHASEVFLKKLLSEETKVPVENIDSSEGLEIYGIDSIMIMSLTSQLEKFFGSLSKTLFFEYQTIDRLAEFLVDHYRDLLIDLLGLAPKQAMQNNSFIENSLTTLQQTRSVAISGPINKAISVSINGPICEPKIQIEKSSNEHTDFAIIGVSGQYPEANNLEAFWENLKAGRDSVTEIPLERWDYRIYFDPEKGKEGKIYSKWGAFLDHVDKFDPLFFNISPKEAKIMDPQERLFLQCAWHTFEDAGYSREKIEGTPVGVFAGVTWGEYQLYGVEETVKGRPISSSSVYASVANRVSYIYNLHGPSIAIDTMCASSLTALHMACESIRTGECSMALAGGVNVSLHPNKYLYLSQGRFASSNGRCKAFGVGGDGYVPGEGVGAVLVKSLKQAQEDGDHIYAVIKGTSINHGGKTNGYTVPNPNAQADLVVKALQKANINPRTISYMEAHGTGTALGDPIEMNGLAKAFGEFTGDNQFCAIGSSKSNIGHLESAAGIAGLTKILLQMKYKMLVPSIHTEQLNPNIDFNASPFYVQRELSEWMKPTILEHGVEVEYPRRAAVSSFGAGGSNSHVILEEYKNIEDHQRYPEIEYMIILSAKNSERLKVYAKEFCDFLEKADQISMRDMAYTLQVGRDAMEERLALVIATKDELKRKLTAFYNQEDTSFIHQNNIKKDKNKAKLLVDGKAGQAFINTLLYENELERLAALWVIGIEIDWNLLYKGFKPNRLPLPTYPFALERYWISQDEHTVQNQTSKIHPLLDCNISNFKEQKFTTQLLGSEFYLSDHIIGGEKLFPGVACLEMARKAGEISGERKVKSIKDTVWLKPISVKENPEDIHISLYPSEHCAEYEITSQDQDNKRIVHAQGIVHYETEEIDSSEESINLDAIKNRCPVEIKKDEYYTKLGSIGFHYGAAFQPVKEIYKNSREALAYLELPEGLKSEFNDYLLHPTIVDGALHPVISLMDIMKDDTSSLYLPFMLGEIEMIKPIVEKCYSYVELEDDTIHDSSLKKFNIKILNELGEVLIKIKSFTTKARKEESIHMNGDGRILEIFKKLAQGNIDIKKVESIIRR